MFERQLYSRMARLATVMTLVSGILLSGTAFGQQAGIDPQAGKLLKAAITYLADQQQFSLHTQNTLEDLLDSGQRVDIDVSALVTVGRPNKLRAERKGDLVDQVFYYDGKQLTLQNPSANVYATVPAPKTIEGMLDFTRESLGLIVPAADLIYSNAYPLLMEDVTSARVLGKTVINGVRCNHLAFSRPGVDFQVWIADSGQPLFQKYVVTDTATPELLSVTTVMSNWAVGAAVADTSFTFVPPEEASEITFMRLDASSGSSPKDPTGATK